LKKSGRDPLGRRRIFPSPLVSEDAYGISMNILHKQQQKTAGRFYFFVIYFDVIFTTENDRLSFLPSLCLFILI